MQMLEPVVAISRLKSQLKSRNCLSSSKGTLPDSDARNAHSKRPKRSSSFSSTSLPALSTPTNLESSKEVIFHFVALSFLSSFRFSALLLI